MPVFQRMLLSVAMAAAALWSIERSPAFADSVSDGQNIAARWCAACHDIGFGERRSANDLAPSFEAVSRRGGITRTQLESWIGHPHPPMPNLHLTRSEVDSLVVYIESLKAAR